VADVERDIDLLYQLPLSEFTAARNALARTHAGDTAARIKRLVKPNALAWAVNQLVWRERPLYDRLMQAGAALRAAQVTALEGRPAALAECGDQHRKALADARRAAHRLAPGVDADPLSRTLDALSLSAGGAEPPGRLTAAVQPAGFEALGGLTLPPPRRPAVAAPPVPASSRETARQRAMEIRRRKAAAEVAAAEAAVAAAERDLEAARTRLRLLR
jgi:hypothetical protein